MRVCQHHHGKVMLGGEQGNDCPVCLAGDWYMREDDQHRINLCNIFVPWVDWVTDQQAIFEQQATDYLVRELLENPVGVFLRFVEFALEAREPVTVYITKCPTCQVMRDDPEPKYGASSTEGIPFIVQHEDCPQCRLLSRIQPHWDGCEEDHLLCACFFATDSLRKRVIDAEDACAEHAEQIRAAVEAERRRCVQVIESTVLTQAAWEGNADIICLNGKPTGGTITEHSREFERWWPAVKKEIAKAILAPPEEEPPDAT